MAEAGWYPDPQDPNAQRYYDGQSWTEHQRAVAESAPPPPPPAPPPPVAVPQPPWGGQQGPGPQTWTGPGAPAWHQPPPPGAQFPPYPAAPARRPRNRPLIIGLVAVLVIGLLTGGYFLFLRGDDAPKLTYAGSKIANASDVLKQAEKNVATLVSRRHGVKSEDTRCYFAVPKNPASGAKKTDVDSSLRCGPVLFVDGDAAKTYLSFPLSRTGSKKAATLAVAATPLSPSPAARPAEADLKRPDGQDPPSDSGHLSVPKPPPAAKDVLAASDLGSVAAPPQRDNAQMISLNTGVRLVAAGPVARYGHGDDARSAPAGQQLIAFQIADVPGENDNRSSVGKVSLLVAGGAARPVPPTEDSDTYVVVAVPTGATASLQLADAGYTQSLSLPGGSPGSKNLVVLARKHRSASASATRSIPVRFSNGANSVNATFHATAGLAELDFWVPGHESTHPTATNNAMLHLRLTYTDSLNPGSSYGFEPQLLKLRLPGGRTVSARNVAASANKVFDVFQVPATFTTGTLVIGGSVRTGDVTLTVRKAASIPVSIPAG
jgi:uncharacterized protein DUF2510